MKNFLMLFAAIFMISGSMLFTSCEEDDGPGGGGTTTLPPTVTLTGIPTDSLEIGSTFSFTVTAAKATNDMRDIEVKEDGEKMGSDRLTFQEFSTFNNAQLLTGNDVNNFVFNLDITVPDASGFYVYDVIVSDTEGEATTESFTVQVFEEVVIIATPLDFNETGILFNQAGPAGNGGLDLDNGNSTGSQDAEAELRDVGIDCTLTGENWRAEFGTVNGADMVRVDESVIENFSFAAVDNKEIIENAYSTAGITLSDGVSQAPNCDETAVTDVTDGAAVGDVYAVFAGGRYYLIQVDEINFVVDDAATTQNEANLDNYVLSIKW